MKIFRRWPLRSIGSKFLITLPGIALIYIPIIFMGLFGLPALALQVCVQEPVEGRVLDEATGEPIPKVVLVFGDGQDIYVTSSNEEGRYTGWRSQVLLIKAGYSTRVVDMYEQQSTDFFMKPAL